MICKWSWIFGNPASIGNTIDQPLFVKKDQNEGGKIKLDKFRNNTLLEM